MPSLQSDVLRKVLCQCAGGRPKQGKQDLPCLWDDSRVQKRQRPDIFSLKNDIVAHSPPAHTHLPTFLPLLIIVMTFTFLVKTLQRRLRETPRVIVLGMCLRCT